MDRLAFYPHIQVCTRDYEWKTWSACARNERNGNWFALTSAPVLTLHYWPSSSLIPHLDTMEDTVLVWARFDAKGVFRKMWEVQVHHSICGLLHEWFLRISQRWKRVLGQFSDILIYLCYYTWNSMQQKSYEIHVCFIRYALVFVQRRKTEKPG